jgi:membrane protein implicated in regulation of membrane protease activity
MEPHLMWLGLAFVLVIVELVTTTFYVLMVAVGCLAAAAAAWMGAPEWAQIVIASIVALIGAAALRRSKFGRASGPRASRDPNVNLDIGQSVQVDAWSESGEARVSYRGAQWDIELEPGAARAAGPHTIREIRGSRLIVSPGSR